MRIMIVGSGTVGYHLCKKFAEEGHDVVLVDRNQKKLRRIERELNAFPVFGSGAYFQVLEEAGIEHTDLFIAVTDSDNQQMFLLTFILYVLTSESNLHRENQ